MAKIIMEGDEAKNQVMYELGSQTTAETINLLFSGTVHILKELGLHGARRGDAAFFTAIGRTLEGVMQAFENLVAYGPDGQEEYQEEEGLTIDDLTRTVNF